VANAPKAVIPTVILLHRKYHGLPMQCRVRAIRARVTARKGNQCQLVLVQPGVSKISA
jgi:hypothetical protein